ncbi:hypothetical protein CDV26_08945 [Francisella halioticida]|uniref:Uncharacterized protein n=1 Tax=Francisella halioticida TaxID=549298 RepID=A0ABM6M0G9_9GAMM|nr:hypothetical protein [Francisella halioticida]ASG68499.1 hypothetical protein CDV26_08945 [Francisella halioticida]
MKQIKDYINLIDDSLNVRVNSLESAQSTSPNILMEPKVLLGSSFAISVADSKVQLTKFAAMYPGGATEANTDVVATLENLTVSSTTTSSGSNFIQLYVTSDSLNAISSAYDQVIDGKEKTIKISFETDSLVEGQFYFQPNSKEKGKWGDLIKINTAVEFVTTDHPVLELIGAGNSGPNTIGLIELRNVRATNNFDISIVTENTSDSGKIVKKILANNSSAAS